MDWLQTKPAIPDQEFQRLGGCILPAVKDDNI
jgi:hypothetical protein